MVKIATPISELFDNEKDALKIENCTDCYECRDKTIECEYDRQALFHCDLQPVHEFDNEAFLYLKRIAKKKKDLNFITFHMASSCHEPVLYRRRFRPGGYKYSRKELIDNASKNFKQIRKIFGRAIDIGIENNNYYPTGAYQHIADPDFISTIVYDNDLKFLFDMSHARISAHNLASNYQEYIDNLPLNWTLQLHISDYGLSRNIAIDSHDLPSNRTFQEVRELLSAYPLIEYVTIEYYRNISKLIGVLKKMRKLIDELP